MRGTIDPRRGGWVRRRTLRRVRWRAIAMTGIEASTSPPALPRWFGPRASPDDPAVSALIARVARGAGWADIGGGFNLNLRIDAEPPVVLRVHRPWVRRGRVAGLRRLRERLQRTQVRVARPIRISGCDLLRVADRWAELEEFIDHVQPRRTRTPRPPIRGARTRSHCAQSSLGAQPARTPRRPQNLRPAALLGRLHTPQARPRSEPVVHRMRQLTGELSKLRKEVELPCAPIHGDYKWQRGGTVRRLMGHLRPGFREGQGAAVRHRGQPAPGRTSGALPEPRRLLEHQGTAPQPLTRDEHRWLPGAAALYPCTLDRPPQVLPGTVCLVTAQPLSVLLGTLALYAYAFMAFVAIALLWFLVLGLRNLNSVCRRLAPLILALMVLAILLSPWRYLSMRPSAQLPLF